MRNCLWIETQFKGRTLTVLKGRLLPLTLGKGSVTFQGQQVCDFEWPCWKQQVFPVTGGLKLVLGKNRPIVFFPDPSVYVSVCSGRVWERD